jgi:endonuclease YncB( thermonuclease family)
LVSKHWKPGKKTVTLRPAVRQSRIRREPVRLEPQVDPVKAEARAREREMWGGVAGVLLFAVALAVLVVGVSVATLFHEDRAAAARALRFGQCYNAEGPNCVLDGATIYVARQKVTIAGVEAPQIQDARCDAERSRGIDAAVRLADLLNSGKVTVGAPFRDAYGRAVRKVQVNGEDAGGTLITAGVAREYDGSPQGWCG